jgi:ATP-dependent helicase/nuclease subunit A
LLKHFIGQETNVFIIGDPKQAIYQWRNAEPRIFLEMLKETPLYQGKTKIKKSSNIPYLAASGFIQLELVSNFRSNPDLIELYNDMFGKKMGSIFEDESCTGGYRLPHGNLICKTRLPEDKINEPHIHPMQEDDWDVIATELQRIKLKTRVLHIREIKENQVIWRKAELGDCCILMQSRTKWNELRKELIDRDIRYVMIAEKGLFARPEISLIIDVLDWLGNPHNKDSLIRILRSPLVGMSDRSLRFLAYHDFYLNLALESVDRPNWFDKEGRSLIQGLIDLRDDLRWTREGKKSEMIEKILRYSQLDTIILSHVEGDLCLANIWYLQDIISSWEEEELLQYPELVERLKFYRENGTNAYNMAVLADEKDKTSVKVATVHATKGLEFPVVFHYYPKSDIASQWRFSRQGERIYKADLGRFVSLQQIAPPGTSNEEWEAYFSPDNSLKNSISRLSKPLLYDRLNHEFYAEKWRLYYVALTRASDHIYHNIEKPRGETNWLYWFKRWYDSQKSNTRGIDRAIQPGTSLASPTPVENLKFEQTLYNQCVAQSNIFIPRSLNPSHLYDLLLCPRRYQYAVLQNVKGGPHCQHGTPTDYDAVRFGTLLHQALELRDFSRKEPNPEYQNFINRLKVEDEDEAKQIERGTKSFLDSDFFKDYKLVTLRNKKELEILHVIHEPIADTDIFMNDKIDLLLEISKNNVLIVDYKTNYPTGNNPEDKFARNHYAYQLAAYANAIRDGFGLAVIGTFILSYDITHNEWKEHKISDTIDIRKEILSKIPLKIIDGGLEKNTTREFCQKICEFRMTCKPQLSRIV